ncbi:MAG TPA: 50S ribosomal protein L7/L12 [Syntrophorhabdaceae bacterium]|jgi:large subunit ribosomal protein L7/L12|nr:50S ribosomal protein L7/L12 [Syntrophorhabdaceae bacterium]MDI9561383.1 50S ribosomal protein L7/L12 [Pseudomonadota bacterium]OQC48957.1 MAG: 50S ribosomal protein L7 [Deltaproteobacteria bacterium ADurb.Bin026]MBP8697509.1 50S ribosomal protein L7/L12 [Syntrophorhabdaceae bacterium]MBV6504853.1 50S ribosomal protein L7/L12 [Syntrophorhabdaceae bacterium]
MSVTKEEVIQFIENMTVLELSEFIKALEDKFGVQAAMPMMAAGPGVGQAGPAQEAAPVEEKTEFNVILTGYEAEKKIQVIKVVRAITSLGLKEAKDLVEGVPKPVKEGISKDEAANIKKQLEEVSAQVKVE